MKTRVAIADDHGIVRQGLASLVRASSDLTLVAEAMDGWQALALLDAHVVDVLVLDINLPRLSGIEVFQRAQAQHPTVRVLFLSLQPEDHHAARLVRDGAAGYLSKDRAPEEVLTAIRTIAAGGRVIPPEPAIAKAPHEQLSAREHQVFMLLVHGRGVTDIAAELGLSVSTISTYVGKIREKLGVPNVGAIVAYAHRAGLV